MLRDRLAALSPRERLFLAAGAAAVLVFLLYLLLPDGEEPAVELAAAPPAATAPAAPQPVLPQPVITPPPAAPPVDPAAASGIVLRGVMGGGPRGGAAIFDAPGGAQRVVRVGREIVPGMVLSGIGVSYAIASSGSGEVRFDLNKPGGVAVAVAPASSAVTAPPAVAPVPATQSTQRETMQYRIGLQPVKSGGRVSGYAIKPGAQLPHLAGAGLQPGDVIVSVNGSAFDEERMMELSWAIANSESTEFEFIRNGKRMKAALGGARRQ